jgi:D-amino peptidase
MGMNIYLYSDLEGVAGVNQWDDRSSDRPVDVRRRRRYQRLLMGELNSAAAGAFAGGASRVLLVTGHSDSVLYELADERLEIINGSGYSTWLPELDGSFDGMFFVGAHAMTGTPDATLAHSFSRGIHWNLCGRPIGELGAAAVIAGAHRVPLIMASGDDKLCAEARALVPKIETAQVKVGLGLNCARHLSKERAREEIRMAALRAVERAGKGQIPPCTFAVPPYSCNVRFPVDQAQASENKSGQEWLSPREVNFSSEDLLDLMRKVTY